MNDTPVVINSPPTIVSPPVVTSPQEKYSPLSSYYLRLTWAQWFLHSSLQVVVGMELLVEVCYSLWNVNGQHIHVITVV